MKFFLPSLAFRHQECTPFLNPVSLTEYPPAYPPRGQHQIKNRVSFARRGGGYSVFYSGSVPPVIPPEAAAAPNGLLILLFVTAAFLRVQYGRANGLYAGDKARRQAKKARANLSRLSWSSADCISQALCMARRPMPMSTVRIGR